MSAPNLISATTINGKTAGANLSTTSATSVLSNVSGSGKCLKVNTINVCNYKSTAATIFLYYTDTSAATHALVGSLAVPGNSTLTAIDKSSQYYLEENTSIYAIAGTGGSLSVTISYEDIS